MPDPINLRREQLFEQMTEARTRLRGDLDRFFRAGLDFLANPLEAILELNPETTGAALAEEWTRETREAKETFLQAFAAELDLLRPRAKELVELIREHYSE